LILLSYGFSDLSIKPRSSYVHVTWRARLHRNETKLEVGTVCMDKHQRKGIPGKERSVRRVDHKSGEKEGLSTKQTNKLIVYYLLVLLLKRRVQVCAGLLVLRDPPEHLTD